MRDIICKGKRIDNNEWEVGYAVKGCDRKGQMFIAKSIGVGFLTGGITAYEVKPETIVEFTGLYDKNSRPIFEGDILTLEDTYNGDVQFSWGVFGIEWTEMKRHKNLRGFGARHNLRTFEDGVNEDLEIIGNIFDNPELLEEKL